MGPENAPGGWGNTWIIALLILGWVVSRIILQSRFNDRHRYWMGRRQEQRAAFLAGDKRNLEPRTVTDFPGLPVHVYERLGAELVGSGFRRLGSYEDVGFSRAYPHLRTAYDSYVSGDGTVVATVSVLRERRAWRRAVLRFRGVPSRVDSVQFVTTWPDGSSVITKRLSHMQQSRKSENEMGAGEDRSRVIMELVRPGAEPLKVTLVEHEKVAAEIASRLGPMRVPRVIRGLSDILEHRGATG